jgi:hypothetical protein
MQPHQPIMDAISTVESLLILNLSGNGHELGPGRASHQMLSSRKSQRERNKVADAHQADTCMLQHMGQGWVVVFVTSYFSSTDVSMGCVQRTIMIARCYDSTNLLYVQADILRRTAAPRKPRPALIKQGS